MSALLHLQNEICGVWPDKEKGIIATDEHGQIKCLTGNIVSIQFTTETQSTQRYKGVWPGSVDIAPVVDKINHALRGSESPDANLLVHMNFLVTCL